jgi:hypothetical protein
MLVVVERFIHCYESYKIQHYANQIGYCLYAFDGRNRPGDNCSECALSFILKCIKGKDNKCGGHSGHDGSDGKSYSWLCLL